MTTTTLTADSRLAELRASLDETQERLTTTMRALGTAIADGDERAAAALRRDVAGMESRIAELEAALPIAEQRVQEARTAAEEAERRAAEKLAEELKVAQLAAARKVDGALVALQAAWGDYVAAFVPRTTALRKAGRMAPNRYLGRHLQQAVYKNARQIADLLGLDRTMSPYARKLEELV